MDQPIYLEVKSLAVPVQIIPIHFTLLHHVLILLDLVQEHGPLFITKVDLLLLLLSLRQALMVTLLLTLVPTLVSTLRLVVLHGCVN